MTAEIMPVNPEVMAVVGAHVHETSRHALEAGKVIFYLAAPLHTVAAGWRSCHRLWAATHGDYTISSPCATNKLNNVELERFKQNRGRFPRPCRGARTFS